MKVQKQKSVPFAFVLDLLGEDKVTTKPMFGCTSVYVDDKIVFVLREKTTGKRDNGVWMATKPEHHDSLRKEFPNMRSITVFGTGVTSWQVLPSDSDDFESAVTTACELVLSRDRRIGKVPGAKKPKKKK